MITPFPRQRQHRHADPLGWVLALHSTDAPEHHEEDLAWVRWMFQSVRLRCEQMTFRSEAVDRAALLADWQQYAGTCFLPVLAPALLQAWRAAAEGDDQTLLQVDRDLGVALSAEMTPCSIEAGHILLEKTAGAKYQGALGRLRQRVTEAEAEGHAVTVWGAIAALFQLPPADLLVEYLREEWLVALGQRAHREEPQGSASFIGLAQQALHHLQPLAVVPPPDAK